jgi:hypothetical protein
MDSQLLEFVMIQWYVEPKAKNIVKNFKFMFPYPLKPSNGLWRTFEYNTMILIYEVLLDRVFKNFARFF